MNVKIKSLSSKRLSLHSQRYPDKQVKNSSNIFLKEKNVLQLENEKYKNQVDDLRSNKLEAQIKIKNENEYLKTELRKARTVNG